MEYEIYLDFFLVTIMIVFFKNPIHINWKIISKISKNEKILKPKNIPNEPPKLANKPETDTAGDTVI